MAVIRTPTGFVDDTGAPLGMAKTDTPTTMPNVGGAVLAGAPAATLTNPVGAAAQPPPAAVPNQPSAYQPGAGPPPSATQVSLPTLPIPSAGMRASPDQAPVPASTAAAPTQRGPTSGVSSPVDEALIRAKADAAVQADQGGQDVKSPTALVLGYLQSQGLPRTSENVRRALEANARTPGTIKGLVDEAPPTDTTSAAPSASAGSRRSAPATPAPATPANSQSNAPPAVNAGGGLSASEIAALALGGAGAGAGAYWLARRNAAGNVPGAAGESVATPAERMVGDYVGPSAEYVGRANPGSTGRVIDIPPTALQSPTTRAIDTAVAPQADVRVAPDGVPEIRVSPSGNVPFRGTRNAQTAAEAAELARQARDAARAARNLHLR